MRLPRLLWDLILGLALLAALAPGLYWIAVGLNAALAEAFR